MKSKAVENQGTGGRTLPPQTPKLTPQPPHLASDDEEISILTEHEVEARFGPSLRAQAKHPRAVKVSPNTEDLVASALGTTSPVPQSVPKGIQPVRKVATGSRPEEPHVNGLPSGTEFSSQAAARNSRMPTQLVNGNNKRPLSAVEGASDDQVASLPASSTGPPPDYSSFGYLTKHGNYRCALCMSQLADLEDLDFHERNSTQHIWNLQDEFKLRKAREYLAQISGISIGPRQATPVPTQRMRITGLLNPVPAGQMIDLDVFDSRNDQEPRQGHLENQNHFPTTTEAPDELYDTIEVFRRPPRSTYAPASANGVGAGKPNTPWQRPPLSPPSSWDRVQPPDSSLSSDRQISTGLQAPNPPSGPPVPSVVDADNSSPPPPPPPSSSSTLRPIITTTTAPPTATAAPPMSLMTPTVETSSPAPAPYPKYIPSPGPQTLTPQVRPREPITPDTGNSSSRSQFGSVPPAYNQTPILAAAGTPSVEGLDRREIVRVREVVRQLVGDGQRETPIVINIVTSSSLTTGGYPISSAGGDNVNGDDALPTVSRGLLSSGEYSIRFGDASNVNGQGASPLNDVGILLQNRYDNGHRYADYAVANSGLASRGTSVNQFATINGGGSSRGNGHGDSHGNGSGEDTQSARKRTKTRQELEEEEFIMARE